MQIVELFYKERSIQTSVRQEAVYRLTVESNVQEDIFFRFEYVSRVFIDICRMSRKRLQL